MPLVVPNVCRFTAHGRIIDRPWAQVWDVDLTLPPLESRHDAILDKAQDVWEAYRLHVRLLCGNSWFFDRVSWVDLNAADGETGEITVGPSGTPPFTGNVATQVASNQVAVLVTKNAEGGRGKRNGRSYFAGVPEAHVAGFGFEPADLAAWQAGIDNVYTLLASDGAIGGAENDLVVVHGATSTSDDVTSLTVQPRLATQRRRLRG